MDNASIAIKTCDCCGVTKSADLFDKTPNGTLRAACHECRREWRKKNKERIRRIAGCKPREQIIKDAELRRQEKANAAALRAAVMAAFVGPPKPGKWMGDAALYAWRTENDPLFYARELDRSQMYKVRTRNGYKGSIIGWHQMPDDVIVAKHLMYLISKQLRRRECNEKH